MMPTRLLLLTAALCALASSSYAADGQPPAEQQPVPAIRFFPRYDFGLGADHLSSADARFVWDANLGGEMDFVDYRHGRATFASRYEAVLGEQFRTFDPNQGTYVLDGSLSLRERGVEIAALFHHTSRHLSDRFKRSPVAWNMLGTRVEHQIRGSGIAVALRGDVLGVLSKSNVDYTWQTDGEVRVAVPVGSGTSLIGGGSARLMGVDSTNRRRRQTGVRGEIGVRFAGERGAIELVMAAERRPDAYPLDLTALSWLSAGFRFVSR